MNNPVPMPHEKWVDYKGGDYEGRGIAMHTETNEEMVIYRHCYEQLPSMPSLTFVRPLSMWHDIMPNGRPRFQLPRGYKRLTALQEQAEAMRLAVEE